MEKRRQPLRLCIHCSVQAPGPVFQALTAMREEREHPAQPRRPSHTPRDTYPPHSPLRSHSHNAVQQPAQHAPVARLGERLQEGKASRGAGMACPERQRLPSNAARSTRQQAGREHGCEKSSRHGLGAHTRA